MKSGKCAIVTGSNRGIGLQVLKGILAETDIPNVVLTSRNVENGEKAKNELEEKDRHRVTVLQLDILSIKSVESFKCSIESIFGGFDILIQNSGIAPELTNRSVESLAQTIETNFMGSYRVLRALFPMVRSNGRIVFVSSIFSLRAMYALVPNPNQFEGNEVFDIGQQLFSTTGSAATVSLQDLDNIAQKFVKDHENGQADALGWPSNKQTNIPGYDMSKLLVNALCRAYAAEAKRQRRNVLVNACCPGFCDTNMTSGVPITKPKTANEGAEIILGLALIPETCSRPNGALMIDA